MHHLRSRPSHPSAGMLVLKQATLPLQQYALVACPHCTHLQGVWRSGPDPYQRTVQSSLLPSIHTEAYPDAHQVILITAAKPDARCDRCSRS